MLMSWYEHMLQIVPYIHSKKPSCVCDLKVKNFVLIQWFSVFCMTFQRGNDSHAWGIACNSIRSAVWSSCWFLWNCWKSWNALLKMFYACLVVLKFGNRSDRSIQWIVLLSKILVYDSDSKRSSIIPWRKTPPHKHLQSWYFIAASEPSRTDNPVL